MATASGSPIANLSLTPEQIDRYCRRWGVRELAVFGSVLRDDFGPQSDVDVLVTFEPGRGGDPFEHLDMEQELAAMLGRDVDLVVRSAVERSRNWLRRREILETARTVYAAA